MSETDAARYAKKEDGERMAEDGKGCAECGGLLPPNPALALVEGYACDTCYGGRWDE